MRRPLAVALLLGIVCSAESAHARCSSIADVFRFERSVRGALRCAERELFRTDPPPCSADPPPACAAAEYDAILELVYGAAPAGIADPTTKAGRCQVGVTQAAVAYLRRRLPDRLTGRRRAPLSRLLRKVGERCSGVDVLPANGGRLPAVAEACSTLAQSGAVDEKLLGRCLSARLEGLVDAAVPAAIRPNVIVVLTDDQRSDTLDVMPTLLSEIAGRGVRFHQAFATTSTCTPSRASILSGLYSHNHGVLHNGSLIEGGYAFSHEDNLAGWLHDAGYRTALFGKYMNNSYALGEYKPNAWDEWQIFARDGFAGDNFNSYQMNLDGHLVQVEESATSYSTDRMAGESLRFIREHADEPFFVMYAPYAPHGPCVPAARHAGTFAGIPPARPPNFREADLTLKPNWVRFARQISDPDPSAIDEFRRDCLETLLAVDEAIGELSRTLDQLGLTDDTMVIFLSDNGNQFGEHWWSGKFTSYEEAIRVPFVMRYPLRYPIAQERDEMVANIDVAPTIVAATGVGAAPMDGQNLLALLDGSLAPREDILHESVTDYIVDPNQAIRTAEWKYVHTDATQGVTEELYDLVADPYELANLASDPDLQMLKQDLAALLAVRQGE